MKRHHLLLGFLSCLILILAACRKDNRDIKLEVKNSNGLDLNFSFEEKPAPGTQLIAHLYYAEEENEPFLDREPDKVLKHTLTAKEIAEGLTLTFEGKITSPFAYAIAFADVDDDGKLSEGDIAVAYGGGESLNVREVMRKVATAENVSHRKFLTMIMDRLYSTQRPPLEMLITFPAPPLDGAQLEVGLYYAGTEDEPVTGRTPDIIRQHTLTQSDIDGGLTLVFENLEDVPYLFARAYVDIDGGGDLNHGDIAMFYGGASINDVLQNRALPQNIGPLANVDMALSVWHADEVGPPVDIDGNEYAIVTIGNQEWMTENLKVTHYRTGAPIPTGFTDSDWAGLTSGAYAVYSTPVTGSAAFPVTVATEAEMVARFGRLYNGYTVLDPRGVAPVGWRVPTDEDFKELERFLGMPEADLEISGESTARGATQDVAVKLRSAVWTSAPAGTDDYGFGAAPVGRRHITGAFDKFGAWEGHYMWTSTQNNPTSIYMTARVIRAKPINRYSPSLRSGFSIRCVRDKQQ